MYLALMYADGRLIEANTDVQAIFTLPGEGEYTINAYVWEKGSMKPVEDKLIKSVSFVK